MYKIKVNDEVVIIAGKDKGKVGKVISLNPKNNTVLVEGVNVYKRSVKPSQQFPEGGFVEKNLPIHYSNIAMFSKKVNKASKVKIVTEKGTKTRLLKKCNTNI